jgi:hypothetical protein
MLSSQIDVLVPIGQILTHGNYRCDTGSAGSFKHLATIFVEHRITDMSVGVYNLLHGRH